MKLKERLRENFRKLEERDQRLVIILNGLLVYGFLFCIVIIAIGSIIAGAIDETIGYFILDDIMPVLTHIYGIAMSISGGAFFALAIHYEFIDFGPKKPSPNAQRK